MSRTVLGPVKAMKIWQLQPMMLGNPDASREVNTLPMVYWELWTHTGKDQCK